MDFGAGTYAVGFLAGAASILSPCVLPILPILIASALSRHRLGTAALALGLALSFATVGTFIATLGASIGLGTETLRRVAAVLMVVFGVVMLSARLQTSFGSLSSRIGSGGQRALGSIKGEGPGSQFAIGLLLGLVWSPCVGPTLGAASTLAAQGQNLGQISVADAAVRAWRGPAPFDSWRFVACHDDAHPRLVRFRRSCGQVGDGWLVRAVRRAHTQRSGSQA